MESIIIYTVLLFALIVLFFFGTRLNRQSLQSGKTQGLRQWLTSLSQPQRWLSNLSGSAAAGENLGGTSRVINKDHPEVQKTLAVLSDLYGEFQESTLLMREETALALEASHLETQKQLRQLETRVRAMEALLEQLTSTTVIPGVGAGPRETEANDMQTAYDEGAVRVSAKSSATGVSATGVSAMDASAMGTSVTDVSVSLPGDTANEDTLAESVQGSPNETVARANEPRANEHGTQPELRALYGQILEGLKRGQSREEVAKKLGVGLTEVDIVERVFGQTGNA